MLIHEEEGLLALQFFHAFIMAWIVMFWVTHILSNSHVQHTGPRKGKYLQWVCILDRSIYFKSLKFYTSISEFRITVVVEGFIYHAFRHVLCFLNHNFSIWWCPVTDPFAEAWNYILFIGEQSTTAGQKAIPWLACSRNEKMELKNQNQNKKNQQTHHSVK